MTKKVALSVQVENQAKRIQELESALQEQESQVQAKQLELDKLQGVVNKVQCYLGNVDEWLVQVKPVLDPDGDGVLTVNFDAVIQTIQLTWDRIKISFSQCAGRTINVQLPGGWPGVVVNTALNLLKLRL